MAIILANNATSRLAAPITLSDTELSVLPGDGAKYPDPSPGDYFPLTLVKNDGQLEILKCTARSGDVFTVERAQEGTTPKPFNTGDRVELRLTAGSFDPFLEQVSEEIDEMRQEVDDMLQNARAQFQAAALSF